MWPGTVEPGTHDPATVGIRVPQPHVNAGEVFSFPEAVGDQNRDGADDVSFGPMLYSGRQLTASPARKTLPSPFRTLPAQYVGLLQLDPSGPPAFVVPDTDTSTLEVLDARSDRLSFEHSSYLAAALQNRASAKGWVVNGHHIVEFGFGTRSGETLWRWDIDARCGSRA